MDDIYYRFKVQTQTRCELNVLNGNQIKIKGAPTPSGPSTILYGRVLSTRVDTRPELIYNRLLKLEFDSKVKRHNPLTRNALFDWLRDFKELRVASCPTFVVLQSAKIFCRDTYLEISETRRPFFFFFFFCLLSLMCHTCYIIS